MTGALVCGNKGLFGFLHNTRLFSARNASVSLEDEMIRREDRLLALDNIFNFERYGHGRLLIHFSLQ